MIATPDGAKSKEPALSEVEGGVRTNSKEITDFFAFFLDIEIFVSYIGFHQRPKCAPSAARACFPSDPDRRSPAPPPDGAPRPESLRKGRFGTFSAKRGARAVQVRETGQPPDFPAHSPETGRQKPGKGERIIVALLQSRSGLT